jgi:endonuclease/exonuclease/phosphatase family metal-dependent hydrolase
MTAMPREAGRVLWTLVAVLAVGLSSAGAAGPDVPAEKLPLRVTAITFNIRYSTEADGLNRWDLRRDQARAMLLREAADFIGMQEVLPEQLAFLQESLSDYAVLSRSREVDPARGEAVPLFYRRDRWKLDPERHGTFWLSETPDVPGSKSWQSSLPRVATWARLTDATSGRAVWVYNTHFDHQSERARIEAARLIARRLAERNSDEPVLVMGDLNATSSNEAVRTFVTPPVQLVDAYRAAHPEGAEPGTFHAFTGRRDGGRIDYLFASPTLSLRIVDARVLYDNHKGRYVSDHFPVLTTVEWGESR